MANETELNDLRERIGRLPFGDQCRLIEGVLAEHRRRWEERIAEDQAATVALLASIEAQREHYDREQQRLAGEKRAAG